MKTIKNIVIGMKIVAVSLSVVFGMSSCTDLEEEYETHATGDNADDPVKPGGNNSTNPATADPYATGDNADDPVKPGSN